MIKTLQTFWFVFALYIRQSFSHKLGALSISLTWIVRVMVTILLYQQIYNAIGQDHVNGITFPIAISSMLFFTISLSFGFRDLPNLINREVRSGNLEIWFMKPLPYMMLKIAECFGRNIAITLALLCIIITGAFLANHYIHTDHVTLRIAFGFTFLIGGWIIAILLYGIVGLSAVFLGNIRGIEMIVNKISIIFSGAYVPVGFFPATFRFIGEMVPTSAMFLGGQCFYPDFFDNVSRFAIIQIVWIITLSLGLTGLSRKVRRHMNVNGG